MARLHGFCTFKHHVSVTAHECSGLQQASLWLNLFFWDLSQRDLFESKVSDRQDVAAGVFEGWFPLVGTDPLCHANVTRILLYFQVCQCRRLTA